MYGNIANIGKLNVVDFRRIGGKGMLKIAGMIIVVTLMMLIVGVAAINKAIKEIQEGKQ